MGAPELIVQGTASGTAPVGGTGTTNYIPRWNPGPSTLGDSVITQDGTSIGVRQATPSAYLFNSVVVGDPALGNAGITVASGIANDGTLAFADGTVGNNAYRGYVQYSHTTDTLRFGVAGATQITVLNTGNVGIGTASPTANLHVYKASGVGVTVESGSGTVAIPLSLVSPANTLSMNNRGDISFSLLDSSAYQLGIRTLAAQPIFFATNGTERARIDSAGNFGIGTASPQEKTQVFGNLKVGVYASGSFISLGDEGTTQKNVGIFRGASVNELQLGGYGGIICTTGAAQLGSQTERMRISNAGTQAQSQVAIGTGSFTSGCSLTVTQSIDASQSGQGIKLQGTGGTNNTDPNVLDCYADGGTANSGGVAWTPAISFGGATTGITYTAQVGRYTRVGNTVIAHGYIQLSSKGSATGVVTITGLPTSSNTANLYAAASLSFAINITTTGQLVGRINPNEAQVRLGQFTAAGAFSALTDAAFANNSEISFTIAYPVT